MTPSATLSLTNKSNNSNKEGKESNSSIEKSLSSSSLIGSPYASVDVQQERLVAGPDGNHILCDSPDPSTELPPYAAPDNNITPLNSRENGQQPHEAKKSVSRPPVNNTGSNNRRSLSTERAKPRRVIGNYTLINTLGSGSMGKVRLAVHNITGDKLAVKIVPRRQTKEINKNSSSSGNGNRNKKREKDEHREIRTIREASIMLLLHHPFIVSLKEMVILDPYYYLFMEYANGGQLLDYIISHGKLKEKQARRFSRQIVSALDYCHRNSIVHRDLKIENILISESGNIKIIDFGLSNLFSPRSSLNTFCGSLYFAAPELLNAKAYTGPEVDVWSFGVVLYVLVCGKVPFDDQNMPALHEKIKRGVVDYPSHLSSDCKSILSRTLVTNPAHRATVSELLIHPWMNKGYDAPIDNYLPDRIPLSLPIDMEVVCGMTGFEFGSENEIKTKLERIITSEEYQKAAKILCERTAETHNRNSRQISSSSSSSHLLASRFSTHASSSKSFVLPNDDPQSIPAAYHPLISIYYLVKERIDRENRIASRAKEREEEHQVQLDISETSSDNAKSPHSLHIPDISLPENAHPTSNIVPAFEQSLFGDPDMFASHHTSAGVAYGKKGKTNIRVDEEGHISPADKLHMIENGLGKLFSKSSNGSSGRRHSTNYQHSATSGDYEEENYEEEYGSPNSNNNVLRRLSLALSRSSTDRGPRKPRSRKSSNFNREEATTVSTSTSTPIQIPMAQESYQHGSGGGKVSKSYAPPVKYPNTLHMTQASNGLQQSDLDIATAAAAAASASAAAAASSNTTFGNKISKMLPRRMTLGQSSMNAENHNNFLNMVHGNHQHQQGTTNNEGRFASAKGPVSNLPSHIQDHDSDNHDMSLGHSRHYHRNKHHSNQQHDHEQSFPSAVDGSKETQQKGTADENIKPVFLKGLFSVTTTSTKHPSVIRADLIRVLERIGVKWRESKGRFECVHMPSIDLNRVVVEDEDQPATTSAATAAAVMGDLNQSFSSEDNVIVNSPAPTSSAGNATVPLPDLVVRFEIYIVKVPWLLGMHGLQFRRVGGDPWQYKNMCSKILTELKL